MREVVDAALLAFLPALRHESCCCCCCCCCGGGGPKPTFAWLAERMDRDGLAFFHSVIWDKLNPGLGWRFRRRHEMVMVAHRRGGKLAWQNDARAVANIWEGSPPRDRLHPNEKPEALPAHFIELTTKPDECVLDPFMGAGTTGVAATRLGRRFLGIEIEPRYFDIACRRIEEAQRQGDMFRDAVA
jgi:DNA modification methylase